MFSMKEIFIPSAGSSSNPSEELRYAVRTNDKAKVEKLMKEGVSPDCVTISDFECLIDNVNSHISHYEYNLRFNQFPRNFHSRYDESTENSDQAEILTKYLTENYMKKLEALFLLLNKPFQCTYLQSIGIQCNFQKINESKKSVSKFSKTLSFLQQENKASHSLPEVSNVNRALEGNVVKSIDQGVLSYEGFGLNVSPKANVKNTEELINKTFLANAVKKVEIEKSSIHLKFIVPKESEAIFTANLEAILAKKSEKPTVRMS